MTEHSHIWLSNGCNVMWWVMWKVCIECLRIVQKYLWFLTLKLDTQVTRQILMLLVVSNWKLMFMLTQLTWLVGSRCEICWFVLYGIIIWMHGKHVCGTRLCVARKHTYKQTLLVFAALKEAGFVGKIWKYYHYSVTPNWLSGRILVLLKGNYCQKDIS